MEYYSLFLILFLVVFDNVTSASLNCSSSLNEYFLPTNLSTITHFPSNSNDTLLNSQVCRFHFNVPTGYSVTVMFSTTIPNGYVQTVDSRNVSKSYTDTVSQPTYFLSPGGMVYVVVGKSDGYFNMYFKYSQIRNNFQVSNTVSSTDRNPLTLNTEISYPTVITASTRVSLVTIPQINAYVQYLQATVVFDGQNVNSTFMGSLYDQYMSNNQLVSSGKSLTLVTVGQGSFSSYGTVFLQDYSLTSRFEKFFGLSMEMAPSSLSMKVAANSTHGFITTMGSSNAEYLISAEISNNTLIDVYMGNSLESNKIASYDANNAKSSLPQEFLGIHRTYVIRNGHADIELGRATTASGFQNAYVGRKGFIASRFYKATNYTSQTVTSDLLSSTTREKLCFNLDIKQVDLSNNNSLILTTDSIPTVFNKTNNVPRNQVIYGKTLVVEYRGDSVTEGFYMNFEITKSSSNIHFISVVFIVLAIKYL